jgi:hypothetical protein
MSAPDTSLRIEPVVAPGEPEPLSDEQQVAAEPPAAPAPATATGDLLAEAVALVDELLGLGMPLHPLERRLIAPALATVAPAAEQLGAESAPVPYAWPRLILGAAIVIGRRVLAAAANAAIAREQEQRLSQAESQPTPQATMPVAYGDPRSDPDFIREETP